MSHLKVRYHNWERNSSPLANVRYVPYVNYAYIVKLKRTESGTAELYLILKETNVMFFFFTKYDCVMIA